MSDNYKKLFANLKDGEAPVYLFEKVIDRLRREKQLMTIRRKIYAYSSATVFSLSALVGAFYFLQTEIASSGFMNYFSLLFSDLDVIIPSWQSFSITLLEALPATSLILLLISVAILLNMAKNLAKNIQLFIKPSFI